MKKHPRQLVVISDTHFGSQLALCSPKGVKLDGGGKYMPSKLQLKIWGMWKKFWEWVEVESEGQPWDLVHNGDVIDGSHHNSTDQITHNLTDQRNQAIATLTPIVERCRESGGRYYHVRGTEAHIGQSGCEEEAIAKALGSVPNEEGNFARMELRKDVDGSVIQFLHHIGTVSSNAYESAAVGKELAESFAEAGRWGYQAPDMICRAHRHRFICIMVPTSRGRGWAVVGPSWQAKGMFAHKVAGARMSQPQFGGYIIKKTHGVLHTLEKIWSIEPPAIER